jgi:hypothetical protein
MFRRTGVFLFGAGMAIKEIRSNRGNGVNTVQLYLINYLTEFIMWSQLTRMEISAMLKYFVSLNNSVVAITVIIAPRKQHL